MTQRSDNLNEASLSAETATGFSFQVYDFHSLKDCVLRAVDTYWREPRVWDTLVRKGMTQDWSWTNSASAYESAYRRAHELAAIEGRL